MSTRNVICIVIDRLHAGMVGAYGNSWIDTAALDELAAQSFLFDQAFVDRPELPSLYRAYWSGMHAADQRPLAASSATFPSLLREAGLHTALITDEPDVASLPATAGFSEQINVDPPAVDETAADVSQTCLGRLFGTASQWLRTPREPFCLWIHARGMGGPWDAPLELRNRFADEDDPQPPKLVSVPNYWLPPEVDPDELLGIRHAYAGQISLLDLCLGAFCDDLAESPLAANTQLTLLSARGFALGLHQRVGACDDALYNETTQLTWLMRFPDELGRAARSQVLVQPADLPGTLLEWLDVDRRALGSSDAASLLGVIRGEADVRTDRAYMVSQHDRAIRTRAWHLRQPIHGAAELYAKPSDRWEVNEVSKILPDVVSGLEHALQEAEQAETTAALAPLPELLTNEVD